MADELVDICDESNNIIGKGMKSVAHRDGLWHRAATIWIYNSKGEILLQLRAKNKELAPNLWDISVAGHIGIGEDPLTAAIREVGEEIGLKIEKRDLQFSRIRKYSMNYKHIKNREFYYIYFLKYDKDPKELILQEEEVQEVKFFNPDKLEKELKEHPEKFVPHGTFWQETIKEINNMCEKK